MSIRTSSMLPSLRIRRVANEIWPPPRTRSSTALCSALSSSGMIGGLRPTTSGAAQPNIRSAAGFHSSTVWSMPKATIAFAAHSMTARAVSPARYSPVISSAGSVTTPLMVPPDHHRGSPIAQVNRTPGLRRPAGSSAVLMARMAPISCAERLSGRRGTLARPIPCSAEIEPPCAAASRSTTSSTA